MGNPQDLICPSCNSSVDSSVSVSCDLCGRGLHFSCVSISPDEAATFRIIHRRSPHLKILCVDCTDIFQSPPFSPTTSTFSGAAVENNVFLKYVRSMLVKEIYPLNEKLNSLSAISSKKSVSDDQVIQKLLSEVQLLRTEVNDLKVRNLDLVKSCQTFNTPTFAEKLINTSESTVIIKPKNTSQSVKKTKEDILQSVKPHSSGIEINRVKSVSNGGLVINCASKQHSEKLLNLAGNLSNEYSIKKTNTVLPRIRLVGIPDGLQNDEISSYALKQNPNIFVTDSVFLVHKTWPTYKSKDILQAECSVDVDSYKRLLDSGHLLIGLNGCSVFDGVNILRCFRCNGFNHSAKNCTKNYVCPLCAQSHELKNCPVNKDTDKDDFCCSNCVSLRKVQLFDVQTSHPVWDYNNCSAYKFALGKLKNDVFNIPTNFDFQKLNTTAKKSSS